MKCLKMSSLYLALVMPIVLLVPQQAAGATMRHGPNLRTPGATRWSVADKPSGDDVSFRSIDENRSSSEDFDSFLQLNENTALSEALDGMWSNFLNFHANATLSTKLDEILSTLSRLQKKRKHTLSWIGGSTLVVCVLCSFVYLKMMRGRIQENSVVTIILFWMVMSLLMNLLNKESTNLFPCPLSLVFVQMVVTIIMLSSYTSLSGIRMRDLWRWCLLSVFFGLMLCSSMFAFRHSSVTCLLVLRNCQPILTLFVEKAFLADAPAITRYTVMSCISIALGSALYATHAPGSNVTSQGIHWIFLNCIFTVIHRVFERHLLTSDMKMSFEAMTLIYNLVPVVPVGLLAWSTGETHHWAENRDLLTSPMSIAIIASGGVVGLCLGQSSIMVQACGSATSMNVLQVANKLFIIVAAMFLFSERFNLLSLVGAVLSLLGCAAYGMSQGWNISAPKEVTTPRSPQSAQRSTR